MVQKSIIFARLKTSAGIFNPPVFKIALKISKQRLCEAREEDTGTNSNSSATYYSGLSNDVIANCRAGSAGQPLFGLEGWRNDVHRSTASFILLYSARPPFCRLDMMITLQILSKHLLIEVPFQNGLTLLSEIVLTDVFFFLPDLQHCALHATMMVVVHFVATD